MWDERLTADQRLEYPYWRQLALAVIGQAAKDYVYALVLLNGGRISQVASTYEVRAHPDRIRDECETFFFSGYFRVLTGDGCLDGMELAGLIEADYEQMHERISRAGNGKLWSGDDGIAARRERDRRRAKERYWRKKAEKANKEAKHAEH